MSLPVCSCFIQLDARGEVSQMSRYRSGDCHVSVSEMPPIICPFCCKKIKSKLSTDFQMIVSEVQHVWLLINLTLCLSTCVQVTVSEMPTCRQLIVVWQSAKRHACQLPIVMWQSAKYQLAYSIVWWQSAMFHVSISWLPLVNQLLPLVNQLTASSQSADCHLSISWLPRVNQLIATCITCL